MPFTFPLPSHTWAGPPGPPQPVHNNPTRPQTFSVLISPLRLVLLALSVFYQRAAYYDILAPFWSWANIYNDTQSLLVQFCTLPSVVGTEDFFARCSVDRVVRRLGSCWLWAAPRACSTRELSSPSRPGMLAAAAGAMAMRPATVMTHAVQPADSQAAMDFFLYTIARMRIASGTFFLYLEKRVLMAVGNLSGMWCLVPSLNFFDSWVLEAAENFVVYSGSRISAAVAGFLLDTCKFYHDHWYWFHDKGWRQEEDIACLVRHLQWADQAMWYEGMVMRNRERRLRFLLRRARPCAWCNERGCFAGDESDGDGGYETPPNKSANEQEEDNQEETTARPSSHTDSSPVTDTPSPASDKEPIIPGKSGLAGHWLAAMPYEMGEVESEHNLPSANADANAYNPLIDHPWRVWNRVLARRYPRGVPPLMQLENPFTTPHREEEVRDTDQTTELQEPLLFRLMLRFAAQIEALFQHLQNAERFVFRNAGPWKPFLYYCVLKALFPEIPGVIGLVTAMISVMRTGQYREEAARNLWWQLPVLLLIGILSHV